MLVLPFLFWTAAVRGIAPATVTPKVLRAFGKLLDADFPSMLTFIIR